MGKVGHFHTTGTSIPIERIVLFLPPIGMMVVVAFRLLSGDEPVLLKLFSPYQSTPLVTACAVLAVLATVRRFEFVPVLLLGAALEAIRVALLLSEGRNVIKSWSTFGQGFWYASIAVALWHIVQSSPAQRWQEVDRALLRVALPLAVSLALFGLQLTVLNTPTTFDNVLYAFDGLLGPPVATFVAGLCRNHQALRVLAIIAYQSLWLMMSVFVFVQCQTDQRMAVRLMSRYILLGIIGWLLYFVLPAIDPGSAFWDVYGDQLPSPNEVESGQTRSPEWAPAQRDAVLAYVMGTSSGNGSAPNGKGVGQHWLGLRIHNRVLDVRCERALFDRPYCCGAFHRLPVRGVTAFLPSPRADRAVCGCCGGCGHDCSASRHDTLRYRGFERGALGCQGFGGRRGLIVAGVAFLGRAPGAAVAALTPPPHGNGKGI